MANKRTYINADEELIIQGKLIIEGNIEQKQYINTVNYSETRFEGETFIINADGFDKDDNPNNGTLRLTSGATSVNLTWNNANSTLEIDQTISVNGPITGTFIGNLTGNVTGQVSDISNHDTGDLAEGSNLYFTTARARASVSATDAGGDGSFAYNSTSGVFTYTGPTPAEVRAHLSATDAGGDGSFAYNSTSGVFTYTGPSPTEVRAHFSASNGVTYNPSTGAFQAEESEIQHDSLDGFVADEHVAHSGVTLTAGTGLTGGGDITASRTFNVGANADGSITVNANDIQLNVAYTRGLISVSDTGGDGSLSYNSGTGVFTYTGPSATEVRAHLSGGDGITYTSGTGVIDVDSTVVRTSGAQSIAGEKTFTDQITLSADVLPSISNTYSIGSTTHHVNDIFANVIHAERLDLGDADISDIHNTFYAGEPTGTVVLTRQGGGLIYKHTQPGEPNAGGYYYVDDSNVVTSTNNITIAGTKTFTGTVDLSGATVPGFTIDGELSVTGNVNSLNYVDLQVQNSEIILNSNVATATDAQIKVERGSTGTDTYVKWNEGSDRWQFSNDGSTDNDMLLFSDFSAVDAGGDGSFSYANGVYTYTGPSASEVRAHFSATDAGGDGSFAYNSSTGVFTYTGPSASEVRAHFSAGTGISYNSTTGVISSNDGAIVHDNLSGFVANEHIDHSSVDITAGAGLTGGGDLTATRTLNVGAGDGITVNADDVAVDSTVVRTTGNQSLADAKTFTGTLIIPDSSATANGAIYYDNVAGKAYLYVGGVAKEITPAVDAGDVEDVGATGTNIYAGSRLVGNVTYHGIKSIDGGTYTSLSEASNVITVDGNISAIRGAFSAVDNAGDGTFTYNSATGVFSYSGVSQSQVRNYFSASGDLGYNSTTGVFSFTERTDAEVRGLISGTGLISYNNTTGVISTTADNYGAWSVQTDSGAGAQSTVSSSEVLTIQGGTNITVSNTGRTITISNDNAADITAVIAGTGLTGGGNSGAVTLNFDQTYLSSISSNVTTTGNISADYIIATTRFEGDINGAIQAEIYNASGSILNKGDIVALNGNNHGDTPDAVLADSGNASLMPGFGVVKNQIGINDVGEVVISGKMNFSSHGFTIGAQLYVDGSGTFTETQPSGENQFVQKIATVTNSNTINVAGAGRTNATPNLNNGNIFIGNGSNRSVTAVLNTSIVPEGTNQYYTVARANSAIDARLPNTDSLTEGATNLYYTDARARSALSGSSGVNYNSATGAITADSAEIRGLFSASGDLSYNSATGVFSFTNDAGDIEGVTAGNGLVGGGTTGTVTLDVAGGYGITVNANDIELANSEVRALLSSGTGISYNQLTGAISTNDSQVVHDNLSGFVANEHIDHSGVSITAGAGLTGGGNITASRTLNIGAGAGITVNADNVALTGGIITAGTYGSTANSTKIDEITVDEYGRVTAISTGATGDIEGVTAGNYLTGGGTAGTVTLDVDATTTATADKVVVRDASGDVFANVFQGTATSAQYADLAEKYEADADYEPGTVVVFGGEKEITVTDQFNDHRVAGVISTDPAYMMNSEANGLYVALRGRIPCKVIGPVKKGDVLITSSKPGYAIASTDPQFVSASCIIGKSLANLSDPEGVIEIVV